MADINVARMVCVNNVCVPVEVDIQSILDPHDLAGEDLGHLDVLKVSLVHFKAHDNMVWLLKALSLPHSKWWRSNHAKIPLCEEVLSQLRKVRPKNSRLPMQPTALVPLRIRDRVLWFQNNPRCVVLALVDPDNYIEQEG